MDRLSVLFLRLLLSLQRLQHLLWWLLELHIVKIVSSYIIWVSVKEVRACLSFSVHMCVCVFNPSVCLQVCVLNLLFVLCVALALPCKQWRPLLAGVCTVWTCVLTVCKMLYQLSMVQPIRYSSNCTMVTMPTIKQHLSEFLPSSTPVIAPHLFVSLQPGNSSIDLSRSVLYSGPVDPAQWVGLRKTEGKLLDYLRVRCDVGTKFQNKQFALTT